MAQKPVHFDLGTQFPMRHSLYHHRDQLVPGLMITTLFQFLPLAFFFSTNITLAEFLYNWWMPLLLLAGVVGEFALVSSLYNRVSFEINGIDVRGGVREFLRGSSSYVAPLTEYTALLTFTGQEPGFIDNRPNYQITLFHGQDSNKQVILYSGVKKDVFEKRLEAYQRLFGLPVNPSDLAILEIQPA